MLAVEWSAGVSAAGGCERVVSTRKEQPFQQCFFLCPFTLCGTVDIVIALGVCVGFALF